MKPSILFTTVFVLPAAVSYSEPATTLAGALRTGHEIISVQAVGLNNQATRFVLQDPTTPAKIFVCIHALSSIVVNPSALDKTINEVTLAFSEEVVSDDGQLLGFRWKDGEENDISIEFALTEALEHTNVCVRAS